MERLGACFSILTIWGLKVEKTGTDAIPERRKANETEFRDPESRGKPFVATFYGNPLARQ